MYANTNASGCDDNPDPQALVEDGMARYGLLEETLGDTRARVADAFEVLAFGHFLESGDPEC